MGGRVIFRTKDDVRDWDDRPLFPQRRILEPIVIDLGPRYREWIGHIHDFFSPPTGRDRISEARRRAAGWRRAQALQWAASSPQAGLGYLVRQAIRAGRDLEDGMLARALSALRPYRRGSIDEPIGELFARMRREVERQKRDADIEDIEDIEEDDPRSGPELAALIEEGLAILQDSADEKWDVLRDRVLFPAGDEKIVLFAQPIETVTALATYLERLTGHRPALILGGQDDAERRKEVDRFRHPDGPRLLISSRAGGEGINLQVARRLVHLDVPWNPMDMEQRVGRVHRFGSRRTILVDTLVVKGSREFDAYRVARERLRLIIDTMVDPQHFESLFSRVMSLVPPAEFQDVMEHSPATPLAREDQEQIAALVQSGFEAWAEFHDRFADQQRKLRRQYPGLASWEDAEGFLRQFGGARLIEGFHSQKFRTIEGEITAINESVQVLKLGEGAPLVCGEDGGSAVIGPDGTAALPLGLNQPAIAEVLRRFAFPDRCYGAAFLRWPTGVPVPASFPFGVLAFVRQTLQARGNVWVEHSNSLVVYVLTSNSEPLLLEGEAKGCMLRGLFAAGIRLKASPESPYLERLAQAEATIGDHLRPPDLQERERNLRHAVVPIFAAIVEA